MKFKEQIKGQKIVEVSRHAKFLNIQLSTYNLLIHLRMSGDVLVKQGKIKPEKHDRLILTTLANNRSLVFNDTRKFGRIWLTKDIEKVLGRLGPEPLSVTLHPIGYIMH